MAHDLPKIRQKNNFNSDDNIARTADNTLGVRESVAAGADKLDKTTRDEGDKTRANIEANAGNIVASVNNLAGVAGQGASGIKEAIEAGAEAISGEGNIADLTSAVRESADSGSLRDIAAAIREGKGGDSGADFIPDDITIKGGTKAAPAAVQVSKADGNALSAKADGLFAPSQGSASFFDNVLVLSCYEWVWTLGLNNCHCDRVPEKPPYAFFVLTNGKFKATDGLATKTWSITIEQQIEITPDVLPPSTDMVKWKDYPVLLFVKGADGKYTATGLLSEADRAMRTATVTWNGNDAIQFATPFKSACTSLIVSEKDGNGQSALGVTAVDNKGFKITGAKTVPINICYIAYGQ